MCVCTSEIGKKALPSVREYADVCLHSDTPRYWLDGSGHGVAYLLHDKRFAQVSGRCKVTLNPCGGKLRTDILPIVGPDVNAHIVKRLRAVVVCEILA